MNKFLVENARVVDVFKRVLSQYDATLVDKVNIGIWPIMGRVMVTAVTIQQFPVLERIPFVEQIQDILKKEYDMDTEPYFNEEYNYFGITRKY